MREDSDPTSSALALMAELLWGGGETSPEGGADFLREGGGFLDDIQPSKGWGDVPGSVWSKR